MHNIIAGMRALGLASYFSCALLAGCMAGDTVETVETDYRFEGAGGQIVISRDLAAIRIGNASHPLTQCSDAAVNCIEGGGLKIVVPKICPLSYVSDDAGKYELFGVDAHSGNVGLVPRGNRDTRVTFSRVDGVVGLEFDQEKRAFFSSPNAPVPPGERAKITYYKPGAPYLFRCR